MPSYRAVSPWAILALLVGLASPLALASLLLWVVPLLGVCLSLGALRSIHAQREQLSGAGLARLGLFLSVLMLVYVPARVVQRSAVLQPPAIQLADTALELIREGKLHEAHHLSTRQFLSRNPDQPLADEYAGNEKLTNAFERFRDGEAVAKLRQSGRFTLRRELVESSVGSATTDNFLIRYRIQPEQETRSFPLWVTVERLRENTSGEATWWLRELVLNDPARYP
jgi:hypothetical protein